MTICSHCIYGIPETKQCYMTTWAKCGGKLFDNHETIELKKDKARLDWLADKDQIIGNVQLPTECVRQNFESLRAAIDCAMDIKQ